MTTSDEELPTLRLEKPSLLHHPGAIRSERRIYLQRQAAEHTRELLPDEQDTTLVVARWEFDGVTSPAETPPLLLHSRPRTRTTTSGTGSGISPYTGRDGSDGGGGVLNHS
jgi:hypothetical protein